MLSVEKGFNVVFTGFFHSEVKFPYRLEPGHSCSVLVEAGRLANILRTGGFDGIVEIRALFRDRLGKEYLSTVMKLDIATWERMGSGQ